MKWAVNKAPCLVEHQSCL